MTVVVIEAQLTMDKRRKEGLVDGRSVVELNDAQSYQARYLLTTVNTCLKTFRV